MNYYEIRSTTKSTYSTDLATSVLPSVEYVLSVVEALLLAPHAVIKGQELAGVINGGLLLVLFPDRIAAASASVAIRHVISNT